MISVVALPYHALHLPVSSARSCLAAAPSCGWPLRRGHRASTWCPCVLLSLDTSGFRRPVSGSPMCPWHCCGAPSPHRGDAGTDLAGSAASRGSWSGARRWQTAVRQGRSAWAWFCTGRGNASILRRPRSEPANPHWCQRLEDPEGEVVSRRSAFANTSEGDDQEQKLSRGFLGEKVPVRRL